MPCTYYTPEEERQLAARETEKYKAELDKVTRLLCDVCRAFGPDDKTHFFSEVRGLKSWWSKHKKKDANRIRKEALAKLTPEERKVLGV